MKIYIDIISLFVSFIALSVSLYSFALKEVGLNFFYTEVTSEADDEITFGIAFQNFGDVELFLAEAEFSEFSHDQDATACRQGWEARPSKVMAPLDGRWFVVPIKKTVYKQFRFPVPDLVGGRKHFCVRLEAYDVYGKRYSSYDRILSGVIRLSSSGRISMSATNYHEEPITLASHRYFLRP